MPTLDTRIATVQQRIAEACKRSARLPTEVRMIAVSKTVPLAVVSAAAAAGLRDFGESYAQEGIAKQSDPASAALHEIIVWHFIGPLQGNKTRPVAEHFTWVHGVERVKIAERLSSQRPDHLPPLEVCVQVNLSGEASKAGCRAEDATALCAQVAQLPRLRLRGLMTLPAPFEDPQDARPTFRELRELAAHIRADGAVDPALFNMLSMGMSEDFEVAIEEGATLIRIGSALFGARSPQSLDA